MPQARITFISVVLVLQLGGPPASAAHEPSDTAETASGPHEPPAVAGAQDGAFLAWTEGASTDSYRGAARVHGGYDGGADTALSHARLDAVLLRPSARKAPKTGEHLGLALLSGVSWAGQLDDARFDAGLKAQFVFLEDSGFDLAVGAAYQDEGFNLRPAVAPAVYFGTHAGGVALLANVEYAHGLADDERAGHVRFAMVRELHRRWYVGLDAHASFDLELNDDEPEGEPQMLVRAGPVAGFALHHLFAGVQAGLSVLELRFGSPRAGAVALIGVGAAL